jgi:hypothetical protein
MNPESLRRVLPAFLARRLGRDESRDHLVAGNVSASFEDFAGFVAALKGLREMGLTRFSVFSPVELTDIEHLLPRRGSLLRWVTLVAGFTGCFLGFLLCIGSALLYSLIVGGKDPVAWIPYTVIGFELTILTSGLCTVGAVLVASRLYPRPLAPAYRPGYSNDQFGLSVPCEPAQQPSIATLMSSAGAIEVRED